MRHSTGTLGDHRARALQGVLKGPDWHGVILAKTDRTQALSRNDCQRYFVTMT